MDEDLHHLKLLSIFHYVLAGIMGLMGCFPIIHLVIGSLILTGRISGNDGQSPRSVGLVFVIVASVMILMMWTIAVVLAISGRKLARLESRMYCMVSAGIACLFMPIGTVLGVFTIIVLSRPRVKRMFEGVDPALA